MKYGVAVRFDDGTPRSYEVVDGKKAAAEAVNEWLFESRASIHSIKVVAIEAEGVPVLTLPVLS